MATGNKRQVTWCFMPSQPVRLYEGEERVIEELYTSDAGFFSFFLIFYVGSFSYTSRAGFFFLFFLSGEFLLHIPCWIHFSVGSFSYTSRAGFIFLWVVSLTYPVLASFMRGISLTHPELTSFYVGSFSYTSRAGIFDVRSLFPLQSTLKTTLKKGAGWKLAQETRVKKSYSNQGRKPWNDLNRAERNQTRTE